MGLPPWTMWSDSHTTSWETVSRRIQNRLQALLSTQWLPPPTPAPGIFTAQAGAVSCRDTVFLSWTVPQVAAVVLCLWLYHHTLIPSPGADASTLLNKPDSQPWICGIV